MTIRMAIPNKGRLNERAVELLTKSGIDLGEDWGRKLYVKAKDQDVEVLFVRAQDIPAFIDTGVIDIGITGEDMVAESGYTLTNLFNLGFGICRLSICVPESSNISSFEDMPAGMRIATSFPYVTKKFFDAGKKEVTVIEVTGAAEIMPYLGISDMISDLVATGSTLKTNRLKEICTILDSQAAVFSSDKILSSKRKEIVDVVDSIRSVMDAENRKYLMADVPVKMVKDVEKILPGIGGPTILNIAGNNDMVAVHAVVRSEDVYKVVNDLKRLGAKGILTLSIDRLVE